MADEDREAFDRAMSDTPAVEPAPAEAPQPEAAAPEPRADETGRLHGEKGRFVPKTPQEAAQQQPAQAAPVVDAQKPAEPDHRVPLTELLNEREKRQRFEQEITQERRAREQLQRQLQELQQPPKPAPDIFEDPQGYTASIEQRIEQRLRQQEANFSFRLAHRQHGQDFDTAYQSLIQEGERGNRQAVQAVMTSADPGEALMRWHRQNSLYEKTGGDLDKYMAEHSEKLLDDEAFLTKAIERVRARQNGQQTTNGQRPAPVVNLPPSLNRIASAASALDDGDSDTSDAAVFRRSMR